MLGLINGASHSFRIGLSAPGLMNSKGRYRVDRFVWGGPSCCVLASTPLPVNRLNEWRACYSFCFYLLIILVCLQRSLNLPTEVRQTPIAGLPDGGIILRRAVGRLCPAIPT